MPGALDGIKVIDTAINYAGPTTSMYLSDQGADVIKVEARINGDTGRRGGSSPYLGKNSRSFMAINRNKRSITVDLKKPEGREIVQQLAKRADVFVENFRPGVMDRLGLGYKTLTGLNPRLVYATITSFGPKGPYADKAGFDRLVQGMGGAMTRKDAEGRPMTAGTWIADWSTPMLMAYGIALALWQRDKTGVGQRVEGSLLASTLAMQLGDVTIAEDDPTPPPVSEDSPAYSCFQCADGQYINLGAIFPHQFARLCEVLDLPHIANDPRLTDPATRRQLHAEATPIFQVLFQTRTLAEWLEALHKADVPCGPIVERQKVAYEPQIVANDFMVPLTHPVAGRTRVIGTPVRLSANPPRELKPAPQLSEHTEEILRELGYSDERIEALKKDEVV